MEELLESQGVVLPPIVSPKNCRLKLAENQFYFIKCEHILTDSKETEMFNWADFINYIACIRPKYSVLQIMLCIRISCKSYKAPY